MTEPDALEGARAAGVTDVVGIGVDPRVLSIPAVNVPRGLRIHHAIGLHPQALTDEDALAAALALLEERLDREDVVAIGETGLDARAGMPDPSLQERAYRAQLRLAQARGLPVVLHGVRRDAAMLAVFDDEVVRGGPIAALWHGFSSSRDTMRRAVARGIHIAVGFQALNENARRLREAAVDIPRDRLLLETDAPPLPPARIADVAAAVAGLRGATVDDVVRATSDNARAFFRLS